MRIILSEVQSRKLNPHQTDCHRSPSIRIIYIDVKIYCVRMWCVYPYIVPTLNHLADAAGVPYQSCILRAFKKKKGYF